MGWAESISNEYQREVGVEKPILQEWNKNQLKLIECNYFWYLKNQTGTWLNAAPVEDYLMWLVVFFYVIYDVFH